MCEKEGVQRKGAPSVYSPRYGGSCAWTVSSELATAVATGWVGLGRSRMLSSTAAVLVQRCWSLSASSSRFSPAKCSAAAGSSALMISSPCVPVLLWCPSWQETVSRKPKSALVRSASGAVFPPPALHSFSPPPLLLSALGCFSPRFVKAESLSTSSVVVALGSSCSLSCDTGCSAMAGIAIPTFASMLLNSSGVSLSSSLFSFSPSVAPVPTRTPCCCSRC